MPNYEYVTKKEYMPVKKELIHLINLVQDEIRCYFTFRYDFIGSSSRNMITRAIDSNIGYDFDVNLQVNDENEDYSPQKIKDILKKGFDKYNHLFSYDYCEDSTRVITIKFKDIKNSKILHSCDFAIIYNCATGAQQYIYYNKLTQTYSWEYQSQQFYQLHKKIDLIKQYKLWQDVRILYLHKKCTNTNPNNKSRSIFAQTINEIYDKNFQ